MQLRMDDPEWTKTFMEVTKLVHAYYTPLSEKWGGAKTPPPALPTPA